MSLPRKQIYDLVGESHNNPDGSHRQKLLKACHPGNSITLVRDPTNPYDGNAIVATLTSNQKGLGHLSRDDAAVLVAHIEAGVAFKAQVHELTGGLPDFPSFGCRICIVEASKNFRAPLPISTDQKFYNAAKETSALLGSSSKNASGRTVAATLLKRLFR